MVRDWYWLLGKIFEIGSTGISSLGGHSERRTQCVNRFVAEYGRMPLVSTSVKAVDSRKIWFWWYYSLFWLLILLLVWFLRFFGAHTMYNIEFSTSLMYFWNRSSLRTNSTCLLDWFLVFLPCNTRQLPLKMVTYINTLHIFVVNNVSLSFLYLC